LKEAAALILDNPQTDFGTETAGLFDDDDDPDFGLVSLESKPISVLDLQISRPPITDGYLETDEIEDHDIEELPKIQGVFNESHLTGYIDSDTIKPRGKGYLDLNVAQPLGNFLVNTATSGHQVDGYIGSGSDVAVDEDIDYQTDGYLHVEVHDEDFEYGFKDEA
jgi:hypothetical protein